MALRDLNDDIKALWPLWLLVLGAYVGCLVYGFIVCENMTDKEMAELPKSHFCAAGRIKK